MIDFYFQLYYNNIIQKSKCVMLIPEVVHLKKIYNVAVIGGGASGLAAAITNKRCFPDNKVVILEKLDRVGKKIAVTGNGRCNLENLHNDGKAYNNPDFVKRIFDEYDVKSNLDFFNGLGLLVKDDGSGRIYPRSNSASSVIDCLRNETEILGVEILTGYRVESIEKKNNFIINGEIEAENVIVATGGKSSPHQGSDGSGYPILKSLGHSITRLNPSLVQLKTDNEYPKQLKGLRADVSMKLKSDNKVFGQSKGEILFTDYGLSGIASMDLSFYAAKMSQNEIKKSSVEIDFFEEFSREELTDILKKQIKKYSEFPAENIFTGLLIKRVGQIILKYAGISLSDSLQITDDVKLRGIADCAKHFSLSLKGTKGFENATVTSGGVCTDEFYSDTLMSKIVKGLYCCGEILDVDGLCGGYNLHFAWSSGRLAGETRGNIK